MTPPLGSSRPQSISLLDYFCDVGIGEKVGFYFSVQSGGSFDIDYVVQDPNEKVLLEGQGERQGDYIFTANTVSIRPTVCSISSAEDCLLNNLGV